MLAIQLLGPKACFKLLKNLGLKYNPDIVILNVYANDDFNVAQESGSRKLNKRLSLYSNL